MKRRKKGKLPKVKKRKVRKRKNKDESEKQPAWSDAETKTRKAERTYVQQMKNLRTDLNDLMTQVLTEFRSKQEAASRRPSDGATITDSRDGGALARAGPCAGFENLKSLNFLESQAPKFRACSSQVDIKQTMERITPSKKLIMMLASACKTAVNVLVGAKKKSLQNKEKQKEKDLKEAADKRKKNTGGPCSKNWQCIASDVANLGNSKTIHVAKTPSKRMQRIMKDVHIPECWLYFAKSFLGLGFAVTIDCSEKFHCRCCKCLRILALQDSRSPVLRSAKTSTAMFLLMLTIHVGLWPKARLRHLLLGRKGGPSLNLLLFPRQMRC